MGIFRSKKRLSVAIAGVLSIGGVATVALASPGFNFFPENLVTGNLVTSIQRNTDQVKLQTNGPTDVRVQKIVTLANGNSGWHHHPGVVIVTVLKGTVTFTHACGSSTTYGPGLPAGSVFVESGNTSGQASAGPDGATSYATFIAPHATPPVFRIEDDPPPSQCPAGENENSGDNHQNNGGGNH